MHFCSDFKRKYHVAIPVLCNELIVAASNSNTCRRQRTPIVGTGRLGMHLGTPSECFKKQKKNWGKRYTITSLKASTSEDFTVNFVFYSATSLFGLQFSSLELQQPISRRLTPWLRRMPLQKSNQTESSTSSQHPLISSKTCPLFGLKNPPRCLWSAYLKENSTQEVFRGSHQRVKKHHLFNVPYSQISQQSRHLANRQ